MLLHVTSELLCHGAQNCYMTGQLGSEQEKVYLVSFLGLHILEGEGWRPLQALLAQVFLHCSRLQDYQTSVFNFCCNASWWNTSEPISPLCCLWTRNIVWSNTTHCLNSACVDNGKKALPACENLQHSLGRETDAKREIGLSEVDVLSRAFPSKVTHALTSELIVQSGVVDDCLFWSSWGAALYLTLLNIRDKKSFKSLAWKRRVREAPVVWGQVRFPGGADFCGQGGHVQAGVPVHRLRCDLLFCWRQGRWIFKPAKKPHIWSLCSNCGHNQNP